MGMLDELLRQLQDAAEQQRNQPLPGTPRPARSVPTTFAKRAQPPVSVKAQVPVKGQVVNVGEDPVHRTVADSIPAVVESSRRREHPLMARLRQIGRASCRERVLVAV